MWGPVSHKGGGRRPWGLVGGPWVPSGTRCACLRSMCVLSSTFSVLLVDNGRERWLFRARAPRRERSAARFLGRGPMPTRTRLRGTASQATVWRTRMSSGSSMVACGSWSTRWSSHMLERWCAQPPVPTATHWSRQSDVCGRYSGAYRSAGGRRPMQRRPDHDPSTHGRGRRGCYARSLANGPRGCGCRA